MAVTVKIDSLRDLSCIERYGEIVELHRECIAHDFTGGSIQTDWRVLQTVLDDLGVPDYITSPTGENALILVERRASLVAEDTAAVRVELHYERHGQSVNSLAVDEWLVRVSGALSSTKTTSQLDDPADDNDVFHIYAGTDEDWPGEQRGQKAEVTVHSPEITLEAESRTSKTVPQIVSFMGDYLGKVNSLPWFGAGTKRWKCTDCQADPLDWAHAPPLALWHLKMQFQLTPKESGWEEVAMYKDPRTGRPPVDLGPAGSKVIALATADFNDIIPG